MKLLNSLQAFYAMYKYIEEDSKMDSDTWKVSDVLSLSDTDTKFTIHTGGPTGDPAVWQDWKRITQDILKNNECSKLKIIDNYLITKEQALKAMGYFLEQRYWDKNHDMLLKDAVIDLQNIFQSDNFEFSELWKAWLQCLEKSLAFSEIFDDKEV